MADGGGMRGSMATAGGLPRTYGLQRHFTRPDRDRPTAAVDRLTLRRILRYFRPYWLQWIVVLVCIIVAAGLSVLPPLCVAQLVDVAIPEGNRLMVALLAGAMVALAVGNGLIGVLQQSLTVRVGQGIMFDLRNELYTALQRMSLNFYTVTRSGNIVARINNDVGAVQGVVSGTIVAIVSNIATLTATAIALCSMSWRLALMAVIIVPAFYLPSRIVGRIRRRLVSESQEKQASLLVFMNERLHLGGAILMNIFGQRESDANAFSAKSADLRELNIHQAVVGRWLRMVLMSFSAVGPAIVFWYGGYQVIEGELKLGMLIAFAALLTQLYRPLMQLASVYVDILGSFAVFERIFEYLDLQPGVRDKVGALPVPQVAGHLALEGVSFRYPQPAPLSAVEVTERAPAPSFALCDVSFEIKVGEQVALVGPSGAGKTTITHLVPRFYDPDGGRIVLDGHDLRDLKQEGLRRHIGIVTQETFLFHDSIRANLLYARPEASEAEIIEACKAANIHEFIASLPDGYDTMVGERGFRLSGGEKQRVSIARAILKDPGILILDEATSNLDANSEYHIQSALERLLRGRTSLVIAHRLSTILGSDKIVVMQDGRVVEMGPHRELLARDGLYASLFQQQFAKVLPAR